MITPQLNIKYQVLSVQYEALEGFHQGSAPRLEAIDKDLLFDSIQEAQDHILYTKTPNRGAFTILTVYRVAQ